MHTKYVISGGAEAVERLAPLSFSCSHRMYIDLSTFYFVKSEIAGLHYFLKIDYSHHVTCDRIIITWREIFARQGQISILKMDITRAFTLK